MEAAGSRQPSSRKQLHDCAKEILKTCEGRFDEARAQMRHRMKKERNHWLDILIDFAVDELIRDEQQNERRAIADQPVGKDRGLLALVGQFERILDWPLGSGKRLRDATYEDLKAEANNYRKQGKTMMARADWFDALAERTTEGKVEQNITGEEAHQLLVSAETQWA